MEQFIVKDSEINYFVQESTLTIAKIKCKQFNPEIINNLITTTKCKIVHIYLNTKHEQFKEIYEWLHQSFTVKLSKLLFEKETSKIESTIKYKSFLAVEESDEVFQKCLQATTDLDFEKEKQDFKAAQELKSSNKDWNLIALIHNKPIGVLLLEEYPTYFSINYAAILPEHRGKKYTKELLKIAEQIFFEKNSQKKWTESTANNNKAMIQALSSYGFAKTGEIYCFQKVVK